MAAGLGFTWLNVGSMTGDKDNRVAPLRSIPLTRFDMYDTGDVINRDLPKVACSRPWLCDLPFNTMGLE